MGTESKLALALITIVLFNTAMLSVITYKGVEYRNTLRRRTEGIRTVSAVLNGVSPKEPVARQLGAVMDTLMGEFFLGSFNGSVPAFLQNVLTTDIPTIASGVSAWAAQVNATFGGRNCHDVVCAAANQRVECAGRTFWCDAKGSIIPCSQASAGCLPKSLAEGVLAIKSVADKIATFTAVTGAATTPAAMSNGIFRLDVIFDWFSAQFNYGSWVSAGQLVSNFLANLRRVDFSGCARDDNDERTLCWDINSGMATVINTVNQISQLLAPAQNPSPVPTGTPAPQGTSAPGSAGTPIPGYNPGTPIPGYVGTPIPGYVGTPIPGYVGTPIPGSAGTPGPGSAVTPVPETPIPTAAPPTQPPAQIFTVTMQAGTTQEQMVATIAARLSIPASSISIDSSASTANTVVFTFNSPNAGLLSAELSSITASPTERSSLGISSIQSAPVNSSTGSSASDSNTPMYIGIGCGVGGAVLGVAIGIAVYSKMAKATPNSETADPILEMNVQGNRQGML